MIRLLLHGRSLEASFSHESVAVGLSYLNLLIHVSHCDRDRLLQLFNCLVSLFEFALNSTNGKFEQLILSLRFDDLVLKEVFILLKSLRTCHPVLNLFVKLLFFAFHLLTLFIQTIDLLVKLVNSLVLECVITILSV